MEHRKQSREQVHQKVSLYKFGMLDSIAYTENYSDQGMYININGLLFPKNSELEILCTELNNNTHRIVARVAHRDLSGIGVQFKNQEVEQQETEHKKAC